MPPPPPLIYGKYCSRMWLNFIRTYLRPIFFKCYIIYNVNITLADSSISSCHCVSYVIQSLIDCTVVIIAHIELHNKLTIENMIEYKRNSSGYCV